MTMLGRRHNIVSPGYAGHFDHMAIPVDGCLAFYVLGGTMALSTINGVRDGLPATVVGSPGVSPSYVSLQGRVSYLVTPLTDPEVGALFVVARSTDTNAANTTRPTFLGSANGTEEQASLVTSASTSVRLELGLDEGAGPVLSSSVLALDPTQWHAYVGNWSTTRREIRDLTTDATDIDDYPAGTTRLAGVSPIAIGGGSGCLRQGLCDVAVAGIFDHPLTYNEVRNGLYPLIRRVCAERGISI